MIGPVAAPEAMHRRPVAWSLLINGDQFALRPHRRSISRCSIFSVCCKGESEANETRVPVTFQLAAFSDCPARCAY